jgi:hypothetical protein
MVWDLTGVYGPQPENEKMNFVAELRHIRNLMKPEWLILGDFNMIRRAREKNKGTINRRLMRQFNHTIDYLQLLELDLNGKLYTWSNEQDAPTMSRIDRFLATTEWHDFFPQADLQAIGSMTSDHCPLVMQGMAAFSFYKGFRFEAFWTKIDGFNEVVQQAWTSSVRSSDAVLRLHVKMTRTAKALLIWRWKTVGNFNVQLAIIQTVLTLLEKAQESRQLSGDELEFRRSLKMKILGLVAIQKARARQHSRLIWMRLGDANTNFFSQHGKS